jgi:hypothetical protein
MNESTRPKRVVVVDAENPLREISGDFYWLEDHERIVCQARESAYARGYADGVAAAAQRWPRTVVVRYRRSRLRRTINTVFVAFVVLAFLITLISDLVASIHSP